MKLKDINTIMFISHINKMLFFKDPCKKCIVKFTCGNACDKYKNNLVNAKITPGFFKYLLVSPYLFISVAAITLNISLVMCIMLVIESIVFIRWVYRKSDQTKLLDNIMRIDYDTAMMKNMANNRNGELDRQVQTALKF